MKDILPAELAQRPKCPFFYGEDARYTQRMMYNLLMAEDRALIREAFGDADGSHPVFERETIESGSSGICSQIYHSDGLCEYS